MCAHVQVHICACVHHNNFVNSLRNLCNVLLSHLTPPLPLTFYGSTCIHTLPNFMSFYFFIKKTIHQIQFVLTDTTRYEDTHWNMVNSCQPHFWRKLSAPLRTHRLSIVLQLEVTASKPFPQLSASWWAGSLFPAFPNTGPSSQLN